MSNVEQIIFEDEEGPTEEELTKYTIEIPLWSNRWPQKALRGKLRSIGLRRFNQQYRNNPINVEDLTFSFFENTLVYGVNPADIVPRGAEFYTGVDISSSRRPGSVIFSYAYDRKNDLRIVWGDLIKIGRWKGPELRDKLVFEYKRLNSRVIVVESNAIQQTVIEFMRESTKKGEDQLKLPLQSFSTQTTNKNHPDLGLESVNVAFENDKWRFLVEGRKHADACICNMCKAIKEFTQHPSHPTTDIVMAAWFADNALKGKRKPRLYSMGIRR